MLNVIDEFTREVLSIDVGFNVKCYDVIDELRYVVDRWRMDYNHYRPHSSLGYMTPAEFAKLCIDVGCVRPQSCRPEQAELAKHSHKGWTKKQGQRNIACFFQLKILFFYMYFP